MLYSKIMSFISYVALLLVVSYTSLAAYLFFNQRNILYLPEKEMADPGSYGLPMEDITLHTEDHVQVTAWYKAAPVGQPTIIFFHGNAGNLGDRVDRLKTFIQHGYGVLALSYRGYGTSQGKPSEEGLYSDARAAVAYLHAEGIYYSSMILYGESLGSGVATAIASETHGFKAIVLEAPYLSVAKRAKELYPYIPIEFLLKDHFNSYLHLPNVQAPVLIFHGELDDVMPVHHGKQMLALANEPKEGHFYDNVGHTDFNYKQLTETLSEFLIRHLL